ncbi:MAG: asparagine synthetase B family protein, partial [Desulfococcaceae bacterium]
MGCLFGYMGAPSPGLLERMAERLRHRRALGWERVALSVRQGRTAEIGHGIAPWNPGKQLADAPERKALFGYNGVLFPGGGVPEPPEHPPRTLLHALADAPETGLERLDGAFCAALVFGDQLHLIRDPAGVKAIYWTRTRDRLLFASEIKALFADPDVPRRMRPAALPEYLTFSFVPGEGTMMEGIFELQPGTRLFWNGADDPAIRRHFVPESLEPAAANGRPPEVCARELRAELESATARCCAAGDGPPAVFVSGGIDSSAVLALAARRHPEERLRTYSIHFGPKYENENQFVRLITDRYHTRHTWLDIRPKRFLNRMREIIWRLDDPIGDPITVPNFLMAETAAREGNRVLNGEGGDPCFGGPKNIPMILARIYRPENGMPEPEYLAREYLRSYHKCFADLDLLLDRDFFRETGGVGALSRLIAPFFETQPPRRFLNRLMTINIRRKGANLILVKVDKMTSANGLLALPPLFLRNVIEAGMKTPPGLKLAGNVEKNVLKQAVRDIVPRPIVERPKSGMMVPVRFWMQKEMKRFARRALSRRNLERLGYFDPAYVKRILAYDKEEVAGARHGLKIWMLVTFILWHEQMVEG